MIDPRIEELPWEEFMKREPEFSVVSWPDGDMGWYLQGQLHRIGAPAFVKLTTGTKYWYRHGLRHREDGPAVEWDDGSKEWWVKGELHRIHGPALEWVSGKKKWYLNGIEMDALIYFVKMQEMVHNE